jgi:hypothetical protein
MPKVHACKGLILVKTALDSSNGLVFSRKVGMSKVQIAIYSLLPFLPISFLSLALDGF